MSLPQCLPGLSPHQGSRGDWSAHARLTAQSTHGMPYGAFAFTVTAPPVCPLLCDALGVVFDCDGGGAEPDPVAEELMPAGTEVASGPNGTSTWPGATSELGLAV